MTLADRTGAHGRRRDQAPIVALVVASVLLVASVAMAALGALGPAPWQSRSPWGPAGGTSDRWDRMMGGGQPAPGMGGRDDRGMMGGHIWLPGDGRPVASIAQAHARAEQAGASQGLHPGEVMQFTNGFYVELKDANGEPTTEVLVDPTTGAVQTEPGPAMMWSSGARTGRLTEQQASQTATSWLASNRPGESVISVDAYPGYFTIDTAKAGKVVGMLSVNATTGAVWYHTWHGTFVAMEDN